MLVDFEKLLTELESSIKAINLEEVMRIDSQVKSCLSEEIKSLKPEHYAELASILERHNLLIDQVSALKKSTFNQLTQFQKNQKLLKKYQNV